MENPDKSAAVTAAEGRKIPWVVRTYSGHSSAEASNALYQTNLARGQTGLSVAFDLPTQTGYDSDHELARGEVGKVGVPISHIGDMRTLFKDIPLDKMNTSMTINATAPWLLAMYVALADEQGAKRSDLAGTVQNDIIKEYLSRGTYVFPPAPSMKLISDVITWTYKEVPRWNPTNVCSYHLQEAGATPAQELAYALSTAQAVLDLVKESGQVPDADMAKVVGRISFFVNAGIKFITELCKMRAFTEMWDEICRDRYGVEDEKYRRFRYGVQVNSLGLTEPQPENNVYRILLEMLAVVLSKNARARAVQLPAWNEALGLPRPWDQQWSLRLQQIVALETDLLDYGDIFTGSKEIEDKVASLKAEALAEMATIESLGGAIPAVEMGYMKEQLVASNARRMAAIETGEQVVVGVNAYTESAPSPLTASDDDGFLKTDPDAERNQIEALQAWREQRDGAAVEAALAELKSAVSEGRNVMEPSIVCAKAGVTTGEWSSVLRQTFGEYRAPTGVSATATANAPDAASDKVRAEVAAATDKLGRRPKVLVGKPGLDGHSNGAEQIAVKARDSGMEVVYAGIRLTPGEIIASAKEEDVHLIGLSILSGSHVALVSEVLSGLKEAGLGHIPVVLGGIIPEKDAADLLKQGVARVYTPKDFELNTIMSDFVTLVSADETEAA
ncbi:MAG: protein meaA [Alphaproteobacteria bacterium]|nr:protein meaA [Alphaproteobacteria bacterium]MBT4966294.1 protein meaA [Alphaproteobacteria bacterium]MBT5161228.1 protein meaA [Alphaproteobacteria bacterium]MBT6384402.1 protein meaA [Alphaproteobacteria bacterium]